MTTMKSTVGLILDAVSGSGSGDGGSGGGQLIPMIALTGGGYQIEIPAGDLFDGLHNGTYLPILSLHIEEEDLIGFILVTNIYQSGDAIFVSSSIMDFTAQSASDYPVSDGEK